jgi:hypothetical protein
MEHVGRIAGKWFGLTEFGLVKNHGPSGYGIARRQPSRPVNQIDTFALVHTNQGRASGGVVRITNIPRPEDVTSCYYCPWFGYHGTGEHEDHREYNQYQN